MGIIYNYLKNAIQDIKQESKQNPSFVCVLLVLLTIPASYGVNNMALVLLCISVLLNFKKQNFGFSKALIVPILLYILMILSIFWTVNQRETLKALPKEIALILIPAVFFFIKDFTKEQKTKILKYYSYGMVFYTIFWLSKAIVRFIITKDTSVFFYHELVTKDLNAIHVSVYVAIAMFYFFSIEKKNLVYKIIALCLFLFIILLSSKNIIITVIALIFLKILFYSGLSKKAKIYYIGSILIAISLALSIGKVRDRFEEEIIKNIAVVPEDPDNIEQGIKTINVAEAWTKERFRKSDYLPGTAMRVYKFRMFVELFKEEPVFWTGYGLNASKEKLVKKAKEYNLYSGYQGFNFHNQYVQNFAELGLFGFVFLLLIVVINLKNAINLKDFLHIAFAILMISLFLTESFLWRQRGVMFFTLMYCVFNAREYVSLSKQNK